MGLPDELKEWFTARQVERVRFFLQESAKFNVLLNEAAQFEDKVDLKPYLLGLGCDPAIFDTLLAKKIPITSLFCSAEILAQKPQLIRYYRLLAGMTRKAMGRLSLSVDALEDLRSRNRDQKKLQIKLQRVADLLNRGVGQWVHEAVHSHGIQEVFNVVRFLYGVEIDGRWRDRAGDEAEIDFQEFLSDHFVSLGLASRIVDVRNAERELNAKDRITSSLPRERELLLSIELKNGSRIEFRKDPDAAFFNSSGRLRLAIEVKSGTDYQNALNRLGEAAKSFQNIRREHSGALTMLLVTAVTPKMADRLSKKESAVDAYFIINDLYTSADVKRKVIRAIHRALGLPEARLPE